MDTAVLHTTSVNHPANKKQTLYSNGKFFEVPDMDAKAEGEIIKVPLWHISGKMNKEEQARKLVQKALI